MLYYNDTGISNKLSMNIKNLYIILVLSCLLSCESASNPIKDKSTPEETRFSYLKQQNWHQVFFDPGTNGWQSRWMLDGKKAKVVNSELGMEFLAGPVPKEAASHSVLWTKETFSGDLKIEYEYTRTDEATRFVNILYIQATGNEEVGLNPDISKWAEQRTTPAMSEYFNKMNTYHISYAAYGGKNNPDGVDYIRARRYMPQLGKGLKGTEILPDPCFKTELFKTGVKHKITVLKRHNELYMQVSNDEKELLCSWRNTQFPSIESGRIGLRHMATRSATYKNFKISTIKAPQQQLAFPSAEGFGAYTQGGRGGDVYHVTNLKDKGKGSLREGLKKQKGPRTIVFDVSGTIMLNKKLNVTNPYITIAGQTAPGQGITIGGYPFEVGADHVIIRYLRSRLGDLHNHQGDAISVKRGKNIILDHVSASWSVDETLSSQSDKVDNLTVQWSIVSESLLNSTHEKGSHGYGGIIGAIKQTFHHNLYAHHTSRSPKVTGRRHTEVDFRNNVIFNWGYNSVYDGTKSYMNWVNNYYKPGPGTKKKVKQRIFALSDAAVASENRQFNWSNAYTTSLYAEGNFMGGSPQITKNNWDGGIEYKDGASEKEHRAKYPPFWAPSIRQQTAANAYPIVLQHAGSSHSRDEVDRRIINEVKTGKTRYGNKGFIDSQKDVGGWPKIAVINRDSTFDSDQDGMPNHWEKAHNLDPNNASDRNNDDDKDGYTNLEEYLNSIVKSEYKN